MAKKNQASMFDKIIEDEMLSRLLGKELDLEPSAKDLRKTKKEIRKRIEEKHPDLVAQADSANGWVRCGPFRFRPKAVERAEGEVKIGAGVNWTCPVERIE